MSKGNKDLFVLNVQERNASDQFILSRKNVFLWDIDDWVSNLRIKYPALLNISHILSIFLPFRISTMYVIMTVPAES